MYAGIRKFQFILILFYFPVCMARRCFWKNLRFSFRFNLFLFLSKSNHREREKNVCFLSCSSKKNQFDTSIWHWTARKSVGPHLMRQQMCWKIEKCFDAWAPFVLFLPLCFLFFFGSFFSVVRSVCREKKKLLTWFIHISSASFNSDVRIMLNLHDTVKRWDIIFSHATWHLKR